MAAWVAQDNFVGESPEGAWLTVHKGETIQEGDPLRGHLVALDRAGAEAAAKAGVSRTPLFAPLDMGEEEPPPKKAATSRKGSS